MQCANDNRKVRYGFDFTRKPKFHAMIIMAATTANILLWLSLNLNTEFFHEATVMDQLLNLLQILLETAFLSECAILYSHIAIKHFFKGHSFRGNVIKYVVLMMVFVLAVSGLIASFYKLIYPDSETVFMETLFSDVLFTSIISGLLFCNALVINAREAERKMREAELYKLVLQTDPHFIFNRFTTLSELIYSDPEEAEKYVGKLSNLYRYVIRCRPLWRMP